MVVEKIQKLPHPGLRNIKTALAATFCIVLYQLIDRDEGLVLACIGVFICMQDSVDKSWKMGKDRAIGAMLGGVLGTAVGMIPGVNERLYLIAIAGFVGIVIFIFACNLLKIEGSIVMGLATYMVILFGMAEPGMAPWYTAANRTLDTLVGIAVGASVNMLVFRPRPEKFRGHDTVNPVFHYEHRRASHHKTQQKSTKKIQELYIYPEDAMDEDLDFDFRVAISTCQEEHGSFTKFPGYKRRTILLDGELRVAHKEHHDITLGQYEQDMSRGEWETETWGKNTRLSLLTKQGISGKLELLYYNEKLERKNEHYTSFYSLEDGVKLYFENEGKTYKDELNQGDHVIVSWFENGEESYTVEVRHEAGETDRPLVLMIESAKEEKVEA